jgi:hypothetical protein
LKHNKLCLVQLNLAHWRLPLKPKNFQDGNNSRVLLLSVFLLLHLPAHARKKFAGVLFLFL